MSNMIGNNIKISIFGQSHSEAIGVTIDGLPAGEKIDIDKLKAFMSKRAPGKNAYSTKRNEADEPVFLSGIVDGVTCGAPLTAVIYNKDFRSKDYDNLKDIPRPAHADYTAQVKYGGYQDVKGGGHFSGRLTAPLCIAGGICMQLLENRGIYVGSYIKSIGAVSDNAVCENADELSAVYNKEFPTINDETAKKMMAHIEDARIEADSVGGVIECKAFGLPVGLGNPMFDGVENRISQIVFGIPAIKGIEFGNGFECAKLLGSQNNDEYYIEDGKVLTKTNNHGGILGGITSGMPLVFRVAVKPTPSIGKEQNSISLSAGREAKLVIEGRHDPCIVPRAVPCITSATAIAIYDMLLD